MEQTEALPYKSLPLPGTALPAAFYTSESAPYRPYGSFLRLRERLGSSAPGSVLDLWEALKG